jgi:hypothetical protein
MAGKMNKETCARWVLELGANPLDFSLDAKYVGWVQRFELEVSGI